jgi:hypothetical protein
MPALSVDAVVVPSLAIVKPGDRARFVKGGEQAGCPNPSAACAARAFVLGGDPVVVSATAGEYACATFTGPGPKAVSTSGFLWRAQLGAPPTEAPVNASTAWARTWWSGDEQTITIRPKPDGRIVIRGEATWGSSCSLVPSIFLRRLREAARALTLSSSSQTGRDGSVQSKPDR